MLIKTSLRIRPSRSGTVLLFLAIFLFFAAQNTGNNLLYLMSSCFMTCILWTGTISFRNISGLCAELIVPESCFVGQQTVVRCKITDLSGKKHHYLGFEDDFLEVLQPGETAYLCTTLIPACRGNYRLDHLRIFSSYPADLFLTCIELPPAAFKVAPEPVNLNLGGLVNSPAGAIERQQPGKEGDYWMQLPYQDGEDASQISWAISARSLHEWVVIRSVSSGMDRRFYFDFSGLEGEFFEKGLMAVSGLICQLRQRGVVAYVWAEAADNCYAWLSVAKDLPMLVNWLATIRPGAVPLPEHVESEAITIKDLLKVIT